MMNKKGVSVIIGYVLLIVFAMIISAGVYAWLKTYVPSEPLNCPDGVSLFIKDATFNSTSNRLNVTTRNNGRFDIAGYFIHATNNSSQTLPSIDLSNYLIQDQNGIVFGNSVLYEVTGSNSLSPSEEKTNSFNIPNGVGDIYSIRLIPTRFQDEDNRQRFVSCGDSRVQQVIGTGIGGGSCVPSCVGRVCGNDGCGGVCPPNNCGGGSSCNAATGQCVAGVVCGDGNIGGTEQCDGTNLNGQSCTTQGFTGGGILTCGSSCQFNTTQCITGGAVCGNGIIETGEFCDDGDTSSGDGCSSTCTIESGWICSGQPSICTPEAVSSCPAYCVSLNYSGGSCTSSAGTCQSGGGIYQSGGDQWCTGGSQADTCCCTPIVLQLALGYSGFESGAQNWTDGGVDSDRSNTRSKVLDSGANGGTWSWHLQDVGSGAYTERSFNFSGANQIKLEWWGYYTGFESNENDCLLLKVDNNNVSSWGTLNCLNTNIVTQNNWIAQSVTLSSSQYTFDSSVMIRFQAYMDDNSDNFYFDGFNVTRLS